MTDLYNTKNLINNIETDWKDILLSIIEPYANNIDKELNESKQKYTKNFIYPKEQDIFRCFNYFNVNEMKVLILGQDPYHTPNVAMGLAFSCPNNVQMPPSLRNIFKELQRCYNGELRTNTDLSDWSKQGVLLLNTSLSVVINTPNGHSNIWKDFINDLLKYIGNMKDIVVMLWGNSAKQYKILFKDCYILEHTHPSPLSRKPFIGNNHFVLCNEYLREKGKEEIIWV